MSDEVVYSTDDSSSCDESSDIVVEYHDERDYEPLRNKVRSLMNNITPSTKDDVIKEFLSYKFSSLPNEVQKAVVEVIFDKAVKEPNSCPLVIELCRRQVESELRENPRESKFRNRLVNRTQNAFVKIVLNEETVENEQLFPSELDNNDSLFHSRKFGIITVIGQLYRYSILSTKIVQWCLYELQRHTHPVNGVPATPPYNEEHLQCAIQLLMTVGKKLENAPEINGKVYFDQTLGNLKGISSNCSNKTRWMILSLTDLRSNHWVKMSENAVIWDQLDSVFDQLRIAEENLGNTILEKEKLQSEKNEVMANHEKALAEMHSKSTQLDVANRQIRELKDEVDKLNEQKHAAESHGETEFSESVWQNKDAVLIRDQCEEFKNAFELLRSVISSSLLNGMKESDKKMQTENLQIAGELVENASFIRDGFIKSTEKYVKLVKDLLENFTPCDNSITTANSEFNGIEK